MSKMGIGSFMGGLADGYVTGTKLNMAQEKASREKEDWEFQKNQRDLAEQVRQETAQSMAELDARYRNPQPANGIQDPNAPEPMTEPEYNYERHKILIGAYIKAGKLTPADEKVFQDIGRTTKFESFREAAKYAYANPGDVKGIQKRLKKSGVELPEGMQFQLVPLDPNDPQGERDLVGFVPGPDGKPVRQFSFHETVPLFAAADQVTANSFETSKGIRTNRFTARENTANRENQVLVQDLQNSGALAVAGAKASAKENPQEAARGMLEGRVKAAFTNPQGAIDFAKTNLYTAKVGSLMEQLIDGKTSSGRRYQPYEAMYAALSHYAKEEPALAKVLQ
jgi:hypothetical protein